jgi:hypothetical protein
MITLQPYQQRVVDERTELHEKIVKLGEFMRTDFFKSLLPAEQDRLRRQSGWMCGYRATLDERIGAF